MNFDVLVTLMVAISTYEIGTCYPNVWTKGRSTVPQNVIAAVDGAKRVRPNESLKPRSILKQDVANGSAEHGKVYLEGIDNVKEVHPALDVRRRRNKYIPPKPLIQSEKAFNYIKRMVSTFQNTSTEVYGDKENLEKKKLSSVSKPPYNISYAQDRSILKIIKRTYVPPQKLRLIKALLQRFKYKTTSYPSVNSTKPAEGTVCPRSYLTLTDFDSIFTSSDSTVSYDDELEEDKLNDFHNLTVLTSKLDQNKDLHHDSESSTTVEHNETTTDLYKLVLSQVRSDKRRVDMSLAESKLINYITNLNNSPNRVVPATPITLILNEENDEILITNNSMVIPLPLFAKYVGESKMFKRDPFINEGQNISEFIRSKLSYNLSNLDSLNIQREPVFKILYPTMKPEDQMKSPVVGRDNFRKNISVIKLVDYKNESKTEQSIKKLPLEYPVVESLSHFKSHQDPYGSDSETYEIKQGIDSTLIKTPKVNIYSYSNTPGNILDKIPEHLINPLSRLSEIRRLLDGTDEVAAIPYDAFANECSNSLTKRTHFPENKSLKDKKISDQFKTIPRKYAHDIEDSESCVCSTTHHHHRKAHPTRFGMHLDGKHVICSKHTKSTELKPQTDATCLDCSDKEETEQSWGCTCDKVKKVKEHIRRTTTAKCLHVHQSLTRHISTTADYRTLSDANQECTLKIYDDEEEEDDYVTDSEKLELIETQEGENECGQYYVTNRPVDAQGNMVQWYRTTRSSEKQNPTIKKPTRQDLMFSILCGMDCTTCTWSPINCVEYTTKIIPKNFETCLGDFPTNPTFSDFTSKRRCTCACFCNKNPVKSGIPESDTKPLFNTSTHISNYNILKIEDTETSLPNKKATKHNKKVIHASYERLITPHCERPLEPSTEIDLIDSTANDASYESENKDESDLDESQVESNSEVDSILADMSEKADLDGSESQTEDDPYPIIPISTYKAISDIIITDFKSSSISGACSCGRKKLRKGKRGKHCKNKKKYPSDDYEEEHRMSKYIGKYKTYDLDTFEIRNEHRNTQLSENVDVDYIDITEESASNNDVTRSIKSLTGENEESNIYTTESNNSLEYEIMTTLNKIISTLTTETTPHPHLPPAGRKAFPFTKKVLKGHQVVGWISSSNENGKLVKTSRFITPVYPSTNHVLRKSTPKKTVTRLRNVKHSTIPKLKKTTKRHYAYQTIKNVKHISEKPKNIKILKNNKQRPSETLSLPKVLVKSNDVASVKIVIGTKDGRLLSSKERINGANSKKKFFTFEAKL